MANDSPAFAVPVLEIVLVVLLLSLALVSLRILRSRRRR